MATNTQLIGLTTEELEAMSDEQLLAALEPVLKYCKPLVAYVVKEPKEETATSAEPKIQVDPLVAKAARKAKKVKEKSIQSQQGILLDTIRMMKEAGLDTTSFMADLPPEIKLKQEVETAIAMSK